MPKRILVFNDTEEILQLFEEILVEEGYQVETHTLGERDIAHVKKQPPDLIISDHSITNEKLGWEFLQKLKMTKETAKIPLILCTTNLRLVGDNMGRISDSGVKVLPKPFEIEELLAIVESVIGKADTEKSKTKFDTNDQ